MLGSGQNNHLAIQEKYKRDESNARKALSEMRKDRKPSPKGFDVALDISAAEPVLSTEA
jgi:hypothetical protein